MRYSPHTLSDKNYASYGFAYLPIVLIVSLVLVIGVGLIVMQQHLSTPQNANEQNPTFNESTMSAKQKESLQTDSLEVSAKPTPSPTPEETMLPHALLLSAHVTASGVQLTWTYTGTASNGFKILVSVNPNPTFPKRDGDMAESDELSTSRSFTWSGLDPNKTYHFRVGVYGGEGHISLYSNDVTVVVPPETPEPTETPTETSINLSAVSENAGTATLNWTLQGSAPHGFQVLWGTNEDPSYPSDSHYYVTSSDATSYTVTGLTSGTTYHFRVGRYLNGDNVVDIYSNDVSVTVK